jgi:hypothetical protein
MLYLKGRAKTQKFMLGFLSGGPTMGVERKKVKAM